MGKESVTARERGRDGDRQRKKSVREIGVWGREMLEKERGNVSERGNTVMTDN